MNITTYVHNLIDRGSHNIVFFIKTITDMVGCLERWSCGESNPGAMDDTPHPVTIHQPHTQYSIKDLNKKLLRSFISSGSISLNFQM